MKTISSALKAHLAQDVTTLCTCWKITRTDGVVLGFTDHDADITLGPLTYLARTGYTRTAVTSDQAFSVDNMEVFGMLDSSYIDEHDLRNGVYNYARVDIFLVNWRDTTQGTMAMRRGTFGEVTVTPNGYFKTELRGLTQALAANFGAVISPTCRADLGDSRCKVPINPPEWTPSTAVAAGTWIKAQITPSADDPYDGKIWLCTTAGTTGTTIPSSWSPGGTTDGSVVWTGYNSFTKQGSILAVTDRKTFTASGITVPASALYGPLVDTLGLSYTVNGGTLAGMPLNITRQITCTISANNGNTIDVNIGVIGAGTLHSYSTLHGTSSVLLVGTFPQIQAIVSSGLTWVNGAAITGTVTITAHDDLGGPSYSQTIPMPDNAAYYTNATLFFTTGQNAGKAMEVKSYASGVINLWLSMPFIPAPGDKFRIYPGCNKTKSNCRLFGNVLNMRAEADLPGQDFLYAANMSM